MSLVVVSHRSRNSIESSFLTPWPAILPSSSIININLLYLSTSSTFLPHFTAAVINYHVSICCAPAQVQGTFLEILSVDDRNNAMGYAYSFWRHPAVVLLV
jgi:hypothetical protein